MKPTWAQRVHLRVLGTFVLNFKIVCPFLYRGHLFIPVGQYYAILYIYITLKCWGRLFKTQQISLLGLCLNLSCNILVHCLEQPSLIIKQSGATSRRWEPNGHQTYSLICSQDNKYGCLISSGRQLHKWCPHMHSGKVEAREKWEWPWHAGDASRDLILWLRGERCHAAHLERWKMPPRSTLN